MKHPESVVVSIDYCANYTMPHLITRRIISPIECMPNGDILALCLSKGANRRFKKNRVKRFQLIDANTVLAPAPFAEIDMSISDPRPADCRP